MMCDILLLSSVPRKGRRVGIQRREQAGGRKNGLRANDSKVDSRLKSAQCGQP
jgi:hypothetical protein